MPLISSVPNVFDELTAQLEAREGLADVNILSAYLDDTQRRDALMLIDVEADQEWGALGNRRIDEDYVIRGAIWIYRRGSDDKVAMKAARDRAYAVFGELVEQVRGDPRINQTVRQSIPSVGNLTQWYDSETRLAILEFEIHVKNELRLA
jgi:hypothetical protein